ncbi:MAG: DUF3596 domain-containing protein [Gammaproteobacteria bacterium]
MASIRTRHETGTLFLDFRFRGVRCREQTLLTDTPANRRKLKLVVDRIEAEITLGTFDYQKFFPDSANARHFAAPSGSAERAVPAVTFGEFIEQWFVQAKVAWQPSHIRRARSSFDSRIIPYFSKRRIDEISKDDVLNFRAHLAALPGRKPGSTLSNQRINHLMGFLGQVMESAAERYGFANPCTTVKPLRIPKRDVKPFTLEEVRLILEKVREDFRDYYAVRFFTGMRTGEIDGLKWKYVDFERRLILVRESLVDGAEADTKTTSSIRDIQMSDVVLDALRCQYESTGSQEFVFVRPGGRPLSYPIVSKYVWYPLLEKLELEPRNPYQTRHTAATFWLGAGENPEWVARQLGHSSTEMLFKRYSRFIPNLTRQDGSAANAFVNQFLKNEGDNV